MEEALAGEGFWVWLAWLVEFVVGGGLGVRTLRVELKDVDVAVCVCDHDIELFFVGEEFGGHDFHLRARLAEEDHLVGLFLW